MTSSASRSSLDLETVYTSDTLGSALALVESEIVSAVAQRGAAALCLSGGSTPLPLYRALAAADLPWDRVTFAIGDERFVPHDHPDSNYGALKSALLDRVAAPGAVLAWPILADPAASAVAYERLLDERLGEEPRFDLVLLGLGADGHTASLFPGTGAATSRDTALATFVPGHGWRLSLGVRTLSSCRTVLFLVEGSSKADALRLNFPQAFDDAESSTALDQRPGEAAIPDPDHAPASAIRAFGRLVLITDSLRPSSSPP